MKLSKFPHPLHIVSLGALQVESISSIRALQFRLSTRGENKIVPNSGHFIQLEKPSAVIEAIHRVVTEIGQQSHK